MIPGIGFPIWLHTCTMYFVVTILFLEVFLILLYYSSERMALWDIGASNKDADRWQRKEYLQKTVSGARLGLTALI